MFEFLEEKYHARPRHTAHNSSAAVPAGQRHARAPLPPMQPPPSPMPGNTQVAPWNAANDASFAFSQASQSQALISSGSCLGSTSSDGISSLRASDEASEGRRSGASRSSNSGDAVASGQSPLDVMDPQYNPFQSKKRARPAASPSASPPPLPSPSPSPSKKKKRKGKKEKSTGKKHALPVQQLPELQHDTPGLQHCLVPAPAPLQQQQQQQQQAPLRPPPPPPPLHEKGAEAAAPSAASSLVAAGRSAPLWNQERRSAWVRGQAPGLATRAFGLASGDPALHEEAVRFRSQHASSAESFLNKNYTLHY